MLNKQALVALVVINVVMFVGYHSARHPALRKESTRNCFNASSAAPAKRQAPARHYPNKLRFDRMLPTGLGDRFSVYLCVAAYAHALNATCYAYWYNEDHNTQRQYDLAEIKRVMTLPSNLHIYNSRDEFLAQTANMSDLEWSDGTLPATLAYDGLYTTALRTFKHGPLTMSQPAFERSYREVAGEWDVHVKHIMLPPFLRYVVLHVRGSDKGPGGSYKPSLKSEPGAAWVESDHSTSVHYCTYEAVDYIHRAHPGLPIFLVSEDQSAKRRVMADFGHVLSSLPYPAFAGNMAKTKLTGELMDMELMIHARGIIQHAPASWSAFSSNIAAAKSIPLLNTWKGYDKLFNHAGYSGSIPSEFLICEEHDIAKNIAEFARRLDI